MQSWPGRTRQPAQRNGRNVGPLNALWTMISNVPCATQSFNPRGRYLGQSHLKMETCASRPNPETQGQDGTPDVPSFPRKRDSRPLCSQRDAGLARSARQSGCALVWSRAGPFNDRVEALLNVTCNRPGAIPGIFASVDRGRGMAWMRAHIRAHGGAVRMAFLPANYVLTSTACVGFRRDRKPRLHRWGLDPPRFTDANGPPRSGSEFPHACPQFSHTPFRTSRAVPVLGCHHHGRTVRPITQRCIFLVLD